MRKLLVVTALLLFAGITFGQTSKANTVDIDADEAAINDLLDRMEAGDASVMAFISEDALICGTDPSEFWNKEEYLGLFDQGSSNPPPDIEYFGDRKIKVAPDGSSAIAVVQFFIDWSPKIPWRTVYHFIKTNDQWMIYFINIAFVPKNEDIGKINEVIE